MNQKHKAKHQLLHKHLDELVADFIQHTKLLPSTTSIAELIRWSYTQTQEPTERSK
jgi:hypothetical protein